VVWDDRKDMRAGVSDLIGRGGGIEGSLTRDGKGWGDERIGAEVGCSGFDR